MSSSSSISILVGIQNFRARVIKLPGEWLKILIGAFILLLHQQLYKSQGIKLPLVYLQVMSLPILKLKNKLKGQKKIGV